MISNYRNFTKRTYFYKLWFKLFIFTYVYFGYFIIVLNFFQHNRNFFTIRSISSEKFYHFLIPSLSWAAFEVVVNSNLNFSSGFAYLKQPLAANAPSWKPDKINFNLPGYEQISPIANIPSIFVSKFSVFTSIVFLLIVNPQSNIGPSCMIKPKKPRT